MQADHHLLVSGFIRSNIDALDEHIHNLQTQRLPDPEDEHATSRLISAPFDSREYDKVREIGSPLKPVTFQDFENTHTGDDAFENFRIKLGDFMTLFLPHYNIPLPGGKAIRFKSTDLVRDLL